jgi:hypothetical protein
MKGLMQVVLLSCLGATVGCGDSGTWQHGGSAAYADMRFESPDGSSFTGLYAGDWMFRDMPVPKIWLTIGESEPFFLPDLRQRNARELFGDPKTNHAIDGVELAIYSMGGDSRIEFRGEKIEFFYADAAEHVAVGLAEGGPFHSLPLARERMIELFGKPKEFEVSEGKGWRP